MSTPLFTVSGSGIYKDTNSNIEISCNFIDCSGLIGEIIPSISKNTPDGFLLCDGSLCVVSDYPELASVLGITTTTFNLPNLSGVFPRYNPSVGLNKNSGNNKLSNNQLPAHNHSYNITIDNTYISHTFNDNIKLNNTHTHNGSFNDTHTHNINYQAISSYTNDSHSHSYTRVGAGSSNDEGVYLSRKAIGIQFSSNTPTNNTQLPPHHSGNDIRNPSYNGNTFQDNWANDPMAYSTDGVAVFDFPGARAAANYTDWRNNFWATRRLWESCATKRCFVQHSHQINNSVYVEDETTNDSNHTHNLDTSIPTVGISNKIYNNNLLTNQTISNAQTVSDPSFSSTAHNHSISTLNDKCLSTSNHNDFIPPYKSVFFYIRYR